MRRFDGNIVEFNYWCPRWIIRQYYPAMKQEQQLIMQKSKIRPTLAFSTEYQLKCEIETNEDNCFHAVPIETRQPIETHTHTHKLWIKWNGIDTTEASRNIMLKIEYRMLCHLNIEWQSISYTSTQAPLMHIRTTNECNNRLALNC